MAKEFRQRTPSEFLQIFKRSKWHILLPTLALGIATAFVVTKLPNMYQSTTTLTVRPPTISPDVVKSLSEEDLSQQLQSMNQEVLSRTNLEPMITKYRLFESERNSGLAPELIVEKMRKNITIEPDRSEDRKVTGFRITYTDRTPESAKDVAGELASKYVNAQSQRQTQGAENTKEFIENSLNEARMNMEAIMQERNQVMSQNIQTLPDLSPNIVAQLESAGQRGQTLSKEKETLIIEKGRLNETINSNNRQIRLIEDFNEKESKEIARNASQLEDSPGYIAFNQDKNKAEAELDTLIKVYRYTEKHPEVIAKRNELKRIDDGIEKLKAEISKRVENATKSSETKGEFQKKGLENDNARLKSQIEQIDLQIQSKDREMSENQALVATYQAKFDTMPSVKLVLDEINSRYQNAKSLYEERQKQLDAAGQQVKREATAQGETIRVVDAANLPSAPLNASKRPMLIMGGAGLGLALGLFLAGIFEIPRLFKIQNIEDAKYYTGLPVLASVPPLLTRQELSWQKRSYWLKLMAGIIAAFGSIPLIIILLQKTRILERFAS